MASERFEPQFASRYLIDDHRLRLPAHDGGQQIRSGLHRVIGDDEDTGIRELAHLATGNDLVHRGRRKVVGPPPGGNWVGSLNRGWFARGPTVYVWRLRPTRSPSMNRPRR
jgi:hypothetical protein